MLKNIFYRACCLLLFIVFALPFPATAEKDLPMITVGHVGHDHQLALYVAAEAGKSLEKQYGVYLKELKPQEVYELYDSGKRVASVRMVRVGGGAKMPAALEQGQIEVGLGGLGPVMKFIDKGSAIKVLAPLNNDGDALVLRNEFPASNWQEFVKAVKKSKQPVKIGYKSPMANAFMILTRALKEEGIRFGQEPVTADGKPVQVIVMNLQGDQNTLPSMEAGLVDGVVVNEPMPSILVQKKAGRRVADLSLLPPAGKWKNHPCCIVAANEAALREKRPVITSLLKAIAAGGDLIRLDRAKTLAAEAKWTRTAPEVGEKSIQNVSYVIRADKAWLSAVDTWLDMMASSNALRKNLKAKSPLDIRSLAFDLQPLSGALSTLTLRSEQREKN